MAAAFSLEEANGAFLERFAPWVRDLDFTITAVHEDGVEMRLPPSDRLCRIGGTLSGQAIMALADTCMVYSVAAALGGFREMATASQNTSFFRPVIDRDLIATGRILKSGRLLVFGEVTMQADGDPRPVAHVTSTYALPPQR